MKEVQAPRGVAVIGAGGIGGVLASELADAGNRVTMCLRTPFDRLEVAIGGESRVVPVELATDPDRVGRADVVFVTTKAQDTAGAAPWLAALGDEGTIVVAVQNGVRHEERLRGLAVSATVLPAIIYCGAERVAPGRIVHHAGTQLILPKGEAGEKVKAVLAGSRFEVLLPDDFLTATWTKLLSNVAVNPLTALTLRRMEVFGEPDVLALASALLREAAEVGRAEGAALTDDVLAKLEKSYAGLAERANAGSSMLYDRLAGQPLEHEFITGAVVEAADRHGLAVPVHRAILALLRAVSGRPPGGAA